MSSTPSFEDPDPRKGLIRTAGVALIGMLGLTVTQIIIFILWPPPTIVTGFFELFRQNWFLGLLSMDLLYIFNNTLLILVYLGLFAVLNREAPTATLIALVFGLIGIAAYYASNTCFEMLSLSRQYYSTTDGTQQTILLAAGQSALETYRGTVFDVYYILNAITLLIFAAVMSRSRVFSRATTGWAWAAGILMIIPSTAGSVGLIFSLLSLIPWMVFSVLAVRVFWQLGWSAKVK